MKKVLNLVYPEKSDIKYKIIPYPDGQKDIVIDSSTIYQYEFGTPIQIKSRLNNAEDLLMIVCTTKALRNLKVKEIHLYVPYIIGLRSDRLFQEGGNRYVKDVIAPILNSQNFESVTCWDAHSSVAENCINNLVNITNEELVKDAFCQIGDFDSRNIDDHCVLVSPDAGASHKIYKLAQAIEYTGDIITCSKERDEKGKLTKCIVPLDQRMFKTIKDIIIIDDICDGGATFINIAKEIKKYFDYPGLQWETKPKIYLIVTHGIFSKGFSELSQYFDGIFCTNSYSDLDAISFENTSQGNHKVKVEDLVKQLNIF